MVSIANDHARIAAPRVFIIDGGKLTETKPRIQSGDRSFAAALAKLETEARRAMQQKPLSVVTKDPTPPSGNLLMCNALENKG